MRANKGYKGFLAWVIVIGNTITPGVAETIIGPGAIDVSAPWNAAGSPYIVQGDATVRIGDTLSIEPGVTVQFDAHVRLVVAGTLIARGADSDTPVVFTASDAATPWGGIVFNDSSSDAIYDINGNYESGSVLQHVIIESAGSSAQQSILGVVNLVSANPAINQVIIRNNKATAIYAGNAVGLLRIKQCVIENNLLVSDPQIKSPGITIRRATATTEALTVEILDNTISSNGFDSTTTASSRGGGIYISNASAIRLSNNTINDNLATDGGGIFLELNGDDISNYLVENNSLDANEALQNGGAINLTDSSATIFNNIIKNNLAGAHSGAVHVDTSRADIESNLMQNNSAGHTGGAVYVEALNPKPPFSLRRNMIINNHAEEHGGGMDLHDAGSNVQVVENMFINNWATDSGDAIHLAGASGLINRNTIAGVGASDVVYLGVTYTFTENTLVDNSNIAAVLLNDANSDSTINNNNILRSVFKTNEGVEIVNRNITAASINAQTNWWGGVTPTAVEFGQTMVDFSNVLADPNTSAPVSPPTGVSVSETGAGIMVQWQHNPETDVAGYQVHWGAKAMSDMSLSLPAYEQVRDAGFVQQYTITDDFTVGDLFVAVTAYYAIAGEDDSNTAVNERMISGYESWYSQEQSINVQNAPQVKPPSNGASGGSGGGGALHGVALLFFLITTLLRLITRKISR